MSDPIERGDAIKALYKYNFVTKEVIEREIMSIPSADRPRGEWIDKAISIIDDMQREGIVDYQQAWEFRMRARMKGADDVLR